ncbi:dTDP-glucose 4:6-dehydratase-like protein [Leptotrombidium deliense]|uniref:dTDP-glucose 4:6-dehydratase-like protein n=1 Tax=Leptotrombidium deliense TaxID=299467 RepID=A0A443SQ47_9ACAR|nr:dTDP-glucose 4:6-dehydratase-like protein [Leptotrombidium deliense]
MEKNGSVSQHVFVTGGAGYLGSTLVPKLLSEGFFVTVFDVFNFGVYSLLSSIHDPKLKLVKGDIRDENALATALCDDVDVIVHLAALVGYPACDSNQQLAKEVNETGTYNITRLLQPHQKLIFSSTGSCYGAVEGVCTEQTPLCPLTLYGQTKVNGEHMVLQAGGIVYRFATLYGISPRMRLDLLINDLTRRAIKESHISIYEPKFRRTFLHVKDAANSIIFAINNYAAMSKNVFNVGDERLNMTKLEAVERICQFIPKCHISICDDGKDSDRRDYDVSYTKISKLGFRASVDFDTGVKELAAILPLVNEHEVNLYRNA